jgi:hypothetical protein
MLLFIPRSLCALKRVAAKAEHSRFGATTGIRIAVSSGLFRAEATDGRRVLVVQGLVPALDPPWPGFKDTPDDAFQTIILPKELERACKLGEDWVQQKFGSVGLATVGNQVYLGLGNDIINTRTVEGRFPNVNAVIPKKRPLFSFRIDPKILAETLLAVSELLPEFSKAVQVFYYGDDQPLGFCAQNADNGMMIDALVVPFIAPKPDPKDKAAESKAQEAEEPKPNGRRRKKDEPAPESNGQPQPEEAIPEAGVQEPTATDAPAPQAANGQKGEEPQPAKRSKKAKAS